MHIFILYKSRRYRIDVARYFFNQQSKQDRRVFIIKAGDYIFHELHAKCIIRQEICKALGGR
jgi:hypothetical protein